MTEPVEPFTLGQRVSKIGGDYRFDGRVVAKFFKLSGALRYVVEDDRGVLHVYSHKNLAPCEGGSREAGGALGAQGGVEPLPADASYCTPAAPAPVCEWTYDTKAKGFRPECDTEVLVIYQHDQECPFCNLPITITEAQR